METLILEGIPLTVPQDRAKLLVKIKKKIFPRRAKSSE